jgi:trehalose 6-phosphate phosphatase
MPSSVNPIQVERLWLFLDYDGTLADFAPTPDHVEPDPELVALLRRLARHPRLRVAVVSGRRLGHVQKLVPVPGIFLAGTYGVQIQTPEGQQIDRLAYEAIRPTLDALKPRWTCLLAGRKGFYLEDKGWALAVHARFANETEAGDVLAAARGLALIAVAGRLGVKAMADRSPGVFRLLGGHKFLEVGPRLAHKGRTVAYLLDRYPWPGALPLYLGDDDKDEEAFGTVKARGGMAILVAHAPRDTAADQRLDSPQAARRWLAGLVDRVGPQTAAETAVLWMGQEGVRPSPTG